MDSFYFLLIQCFFAHNDTTQHFGDSIQ